MEIVDDIIEKSGRFCEISSEVIEEILEILRNSSNNRRQQTACKGLKDFAENALKTGNGNSLYAYVSKDFAANEVESILKEKMQNKLYMVTPATSTTPSGKTKVFPMVVIRNTDAKLFSDAMLELATRKMRRTRIRPDELCADKSKNKIVEINNLSHAEISALQELSKISNSQFIYSVTDNIDHTGEEKESFSVHCDAKYIDKIKSALIQIKANEVSSQGISVGSKDADVKYEEIKAAMAKAATDNKNFFAVSATDLGYYVHVTNSGFTVVKDDQSVFSRAVGEEGYSEHLMYELLALNKPCILDKLEYASPMLEQNVKQHLERYYYEYEPAGPAILENEVKDKIAGIFSDEFAALSVAHNVSESVSDKFLNGDYDEEIILSFNTDESEQVSSFLNKIKQNAKQTISLTIEERSQSEFIKEHSSIDDKISQYDTDERENGGEYPRSR